jgi:hypothetical protein
MSLEPFKTLTRKLSFQSPVKLVKKLFVARIFIEVPKVVRLLFHRCWKDTSLEPC